MSTSTNPSFAALLAAAKEYTSAPLPPVGASILRVADMQMFQPSADGQSPRVSTRLIYAGPLDPAAGEGVDPKQFETIFDTTFVDGPGAAKLNKLAVAGGLGDLAVCESDGNGGVQLNSAFVEALKGREVVADVKHAMRKDTGTPEVRLYNFRGLGA